MQAPPPWANLDILLDLIQRDIPGFSPPNVRRLQQVRETREALETLCDELIEHAIHLPVATRDELLAQCEAIGVDPRCWRLVPPARSIR